MSLGRSLLPVLLYLLLMPAAAPVLAARQLAYPPPRALSQTPRAYGLAYADVAFPSLAGGRMLRGWYLPAPGGSDRTVIIAHGFLNDRTANGRGLPLAQELVRRGFSVLFFDFGGQGRSPGGPVTFGARERWDVAGAVAFARARGARQVGVVGYSLGAAAALLAAADDPGISTVVADSTFTDLDGYLRGLLRRFHVPSAYASYSLRVFGAVTGTGGEPVRPGEAAARLSDRPLLVIHGTDDRVVPVAEGARLYTYSAAGNPRAELWLVPGARHTRSYETAPAAYVDRVAGFLERSMALSRPPVGTRTFRPGGELSLYGGICTCGPPTAARFKE